jgi:hypothetical protein
MRKFFLLLIVLQSSLFVHAFKNKTSKSVTIRGAITKTSDYCGGARPSDEMIKTLHTPQPLAEKKIFIKIGTKNSSDLPIYKSVTADENGNFSVVLKCGVSYIFIEDWKGAALNVPQNTQYVIWDAECFKQRYATPDYLLKVKNSGNPKVLINFHFPCFYKPDCGSYSGPIPP